MTDFESLRVDTFAVDEELIDAASVGPELAHLAQVYLRSPRALVWHNPSPDWRLFVLLLPIASRLSLMANPIFAQLARAWGLHARFVGIDRDGLVHDFRSLLSDRTLKLLVHLLGAELSGDIEQSRVLDTLFGTLAGEMLTVLEQRGDDWSRHLDTEHRLEPGVAASLFERATRFPDFLAALRAALRDDIIDLAFYGRVLRAIDLREEATETRIAALLRSRLDPGVLASLAPTGVGCHLGCYNWLRIDARHAAARAHVLSHLPGLASFFARHLVPPEPVPEPGRADDYDLRWLVVRTDSAHNLRWNEGLRRAIDAGQDRAVIEALSQRFQVPENIIRRLWRERPPAFGQPAAWQIAPVLRQLSGHGWPASDAQWRELLARAVPAEAT